MSLALRPGRSAGPMPAKAELIALSGSYADPELCMGTMHVLSHPCSHLVGLQS